MASGNISRLDTKEAAEYLGLSTQTLENKRSTNKPGPAYYKLGKRIVYRIEDLVAWMAAHRVEPRVEDGANEANVWDREQACRDLNEASRESKEALQRALLEVIKANNLTKIAKHAGMQRSSVYRSFAVDGNPSFYTVAAMMKFLNIEMEFKPVK